ncbi:MAG: hypothetical protein KatS3mg076_1820 [Candidatus Binatia bacterium]|nr:MAG: hypothetical protein KatS3mg076_1820 [Candidatus Binatia bacterium]
MTRLRDFCTRLFFRHFFRLLLFAVSLAEWVCLAAALEHAGVRLAALHHAVGALALYGTNRLLVRLREETLPLLGRASLRVYSAFAFTCLFGALFLVAHDAFWWVLASGAHAAPTPWLETAPDVSRFYGLGAIFVLFLYGYTVGQRRLTVTRLELPLRGAPEALRGLRIVHVSDIHLGRYMSPAAFARYARKIQALDPDLLFLTGDILDSLDAIPGGFPVLARLRGRYGTFAVLGNHDFYAGPDEVARALERHTSFVPLRNERRTLLVRGVPVHVLGLDDLGRDWCRGVSFHPALARLLEDLPEEGVSILLSHRPDVFPQAAEAGVSLVLSGHTHGGQLSLPFWPRPLSLARAVTRYDRDLFRNGESWLYVTRGVGCTGQRIRLFTPRDIGVIEILPDPSLRDA